MTKCFGHARREAAVIALIFGFLGPGSVSADAGSTQKGCPGLGYAGDEHRFRLFQREAPAGDETFRLVENADSIGALSLAAEGKVDLGARRISFVQKLLVDPDTYALRTYDLDLAEGSGVTQSVRAIQSADSVVLSIGGPAGTFRRSFPSAGRAMILDNLVVNHLAILACRLARDGFRSETLSVVVPQVGVVLPALIAPRPPEADGTRKIEIRIATVTEILTIDAVGRFARLEVPSQSLRYERMLTAFDVPQQGGPQGGAPPSPPPETGRIPDSGPPVGRAIFSEETVSFASKGAKFDGILTLPSAGQPIPYPAALLFAGTGPHDRDETIGPNRPFRELARGLAVSGIASLRYDNRDLAAPQTIDPHTVTVQEEAIDDAIAALDFMRARSEIDGARLFIVGHGSGGAIAASVAREDGPIAGLVMIGASPRPLDAILRDQLDRGAAQDPSGSALIRAQLDSLTAGTLPEERMIRGMPPRYYRDYASRDLAGDLRRFPGRVLIIQAGEDPGVGSKDLEMWREAAKMGGKGEVTIQEFPDLGHALIPIKGDPTPASLFVPGNVDPSVIEAIGTFVQSTPRRERSR